MLCSGIILLFVSVVCVSLIVGHVIIKFCVADFQ